MAKISLSRAWDESREVLRRDGRLLGIVALALIVLPSTVQALVTPRAPEGTLPPAGPWLIVAVAAILIALVGQLAIVRLALGPHTTVGDAIAHGAKRMPVYFASVLLWAVPVAALIVFLVTRPDRTNPQPALSIAFFILMLFVIYLSVRLVLASAVASAERIGPVGIVQRSWALSAGNWWRMFAFLALFVLAALCLLFAASAVIGLLVTALLGNPEPMSVGALIIALVSEIVVALVSTVFFVMLARIYVQLAGRAEAEVGVPTTGI